MSKAISLICLCFALQFLKAQNFTNVEINTFGSPNETSIAISPLDTNVMVAASNLDFIYNSFDGGRTWQVQEVSSTYGVYGDPCMVADTAGNFCFFHLTKNPTIVVWPAWSDRVVCQISIDSGNNWTNGSYTTIDSPRMMDKEWACVNPANNNIAVCWTKFDVYGTDNGSDTSRIMFSLSPDGGQSWSPAKRINEYYGNCTDDDSTVEGAVPAFGPNGEIYVAWALADTIYFHRSLDNGNTFTTVDYPVSAQPNGWNYDVPDILRCNGLPYTCCDLSHSAYRGTIYINWTDTRNGSLDPDVFIAKSVDGGDTWSAPIRVNNDPPGKENFMSFMTVDQSNGNIYIIFYDRRSYDSDSTDVYLARSIDGGDSFTNYKISESPFLPQSDVFFGDYTGVSAVNGCVRPVWMRMDTGAMSVWTALVSFKDAVQVIPSGIPEVSPLQTFRLMSANPTSGLCIVRSDEDLPFFAELFDMNGHKLCTYYSGSNHYLKFDMNVLQPASAIYYLKCGDNQYSEVFKLLYAP